MVANKTLIERLDTQTGKLGAIKTLAVAAATAAGASFASGNYVAGAVTGAVALAAYVVYEVL